MADYPLWYIYFFTWFLISLTVPLQPPVLVPYHFLFRVGVDQDSGVSPPPFIFTPFLFCLMILSTKCVCVCVCACVRAKLLQACPTLCNPIGHSLPGSSVCGILQARWGGLPCPSPGDLPDPGIELLSLTSPALACRFFTTSATWEAP